MTNDWHVTLHEVIHAPLSWLARVIHDGYTLVVTDDGGATVHGVRGPDIIISLADHRAPLPLVEGEPERIQAVFDKAERTCIVCGDEITACFGATLARDMMVYPLKKMPRELCGACATAVVAIKDGRHRELLAALSVPASSARREEGRKQPCYNCETGHMQPLTFQVCDSCGDFLVGARQAEFVEKIQSAARCKHLRGFNARGCCFDCDMLIGPSISEHGDKP